MNNLKGKTIIWNGDSICAGNKKRDLWERNAWAGRIAGRNEMTYKNFAVCGGVFVEGLIRDNGNPRHSVSATLDEMRAEFPEADYIIFEGGTNDADLLKGTDRLGSFDPDDFSGDYDRTTFCGAVESVFYRATNYWKGKKIGYIVAQKMGVSAQGRRRRYSYFEVAMELCEKWGIPYLDLWDGCYLNPCLPWMYDPEKDPAGNNEAGTFYRDGQHLTDAGYDLTSEIIENWLQTL